MRINLYGAGLATFLMAGRGLLPKDEETPKYGTVAENAGGPGPPAPPKAAPKDNHH